MDILKIGLFIIGLLILLILIVLLSPKLLSFFVKKLFEVQFQTLPKGYEKAFSRVEVKRDIRCSTDGNHTFDVYYLKSADETRKTYPVIYWIHGEEFYSFTKVLAEVPMDRNRIFFAGDSAGANLVSSFILNQSDEELRKRTGLRQVVDMKKVKGVLFFCGLFDISRFKDMVNVGLFKVAINHLAFAYFGQKDWKKTEGLKDTSLLEHLTEEFPRTFITDGNVFSFIDQAKEVEREINHVGGRVDSLFFDQGTKAIHEYQFKLDTEVGMEALH